MPLDTKQIFFEDSPPIPRGLTIMTKSCSGWAGALKMRAVEGVRRLQGHYLFWSARPAWIIISNIWVIATVCQAAGCMNN